MDSYDEGCQTYLFHANMNKIEFLVCEKFCKNVCKKAIYLKLKHGGSTLGSSTLKRGGSTLKLGSSTLKLGSSTLKRGGSSLKRGGSTLKLGGRTLKHGGSTLVTEAWQHSRNADVKQGRVSNPSLALLWTKK